MTHERTYVVDVGDHAFEVTEIDDYNPEKHAVVLKTTVTPHGCSENEQILAGQIADILTAKRRRAWAQVIKPEM